MPSPETNILPGPAKGILYTGANSGDIVAQVPGVTFVSEVGNILTLSHSGNPITLAVNDWIMWNVAQTFTLNNNQYSTEWGCYTPCDVGQGLADAIDALTSRVEALENP